jgi:hypothetical protein
VNGRVPINVRQTWIRPVLQQQSHSVRLLLHHCDVQWRQFGVILSVYQFKSLVDIERRCFQNLVDGADLIVNESIVQCTKKIIQIKKRKHLMHLN